jgi:hypothetical protein
MNFFKTKQRTPPELVRGLRDAIPKLESGAPGSETRRKVRKLGFCPIGFWVVSERVFFDADLWFAGLRLV